MKHLLLWALLLLATSAAFAQSAPRTGPPRSQTAHPGTKAPNDLLADARARASAIIKAAQEDLQLHRALAEQRAQVEKVEYENGLLSVNEYYDGRRDMIEKDSAAERSSLQKQRAALEELKGKLEALPVSAETPTKKKQDPELRRLSPYMRDVALLYVETVERAVDPVTVSAELADGQFGIVKSIADRIEMHLAADADKNFYEFGLGPLTDHAQLRATLTKNSLIFAGSRAADARSKMAEIDRRLTDVTKLYVHCDSELRTIIKSGEYNGYESIIRACRPQLLER